ncbi:hypothetical protein MRX96_021235 [Rhipicephalus microplus]
MRLIHAFEGTDDELLDQVRRKCFGDFYPPASQAAYRGRANDTFDRPITEDTLKLIRTLVVSRVTYSLPYQRLTKSEQGQVDAMLRKAYKAALKLPPGTPSSKLLALGLHNTFEEFVKRNSPHNCNGSSKHLQAVTCSYASATSASFTTQLVASPFRTNFVPLIRSLPSPEIWIPDYIRAGGKPEWKPSSELMHTKTLRTMLTPPTTTMQTIRL